MPADELSPANAGKPRHRVAELLPGAAGAAKDSDDRVKQAEEEEKELRRERWDLNKEIDQLRRTRDHGE